MPWFRRLGHVGCITLLALAVALTPLLDLVGAPKPAAAAGPTMSGLHVVGNQIRNGSDQTVRLLGVNRSGMEYACIQGWGLFDGPSDAASVAAIAAWGVNTVRIPVNEDCWLGINGVPAAFGGANYQAALANYIALINAQGMAAIIDLHWAAPGTTPANAQTPMPDRDHAPTFWAQVAAAYKDNSAVLFDLFNEPYPDNNTDSAEAWRCWRDGGTCVGVGYQAAGMQELVNAVRGTGATNVILLGGVSYAAHLSQWLAYRPTDPAGNVVAAWHLYNFSQCNTLACWDTEAAPVAAQVPLVGGEIGQNNCAHTFIDPLMDWHDAHGAGYLGWTWNTWGCDGSTGLISDYDGTPTATGIGLKNRLAALGGVPPSPSPSASPSPSPATIVDNLNDFTKMAFHSGSLSFDTANVGSFGNDPSRLVRLARTSEWATWHLQGMRSFSMTTYVLPTDTTNYLSFASSPDGVTFTAIGPAITNLGGTWWRYDYQADLPAGTNYLRITFPNSSASASTPQIGQLTYTNVGAATSPSPTPSPSPSPTPSPSPSPSQQPSPTPSPSPAPEHTLKLSTIGSGNGSVQPGGGAYPAGTTLALVPHPDAGSLFIGWTVDGQTIGWATPLTITIDHDRTVTATFALAPSYPDLGPTAPATEAILQLAARGIIKGYADGTFGPDDPILRAQMAALIGRAMGYGDAPGNPFADRCDPAAPTNCVDDELWNRVAQLASRNVARGYSDPATCAPAAAPCYAPRDFVLHAQVLSFVTRAMVNAEYWQQRPVNPGLYGGVLNGTGHDQDVATFVYYTQAFGGVPDYPTTGGFSAWDQAATRGWFARALWVALNSYFAVAP